MCTIPSKAIPGTDNQKANRGTAGEAGRSCRKDAETALVVMVRVEVTGLVPGTTDAGEKEQEAPMGKPAAQARLTALLKPLWPLTVTV